MKKNHDIIEIAGEVRGETENAWRFFDGTKAEWLPKSLCEWDAGESVMQIPEWLALERGFI